jgi:hypothetical protein
MLYPVELGDHGRLVAKSSATVKRGEPEYGATREPHGEQRVTNSRRKVPFIRIPTDLIEAPRWPTLSPAAVDMFPTRDPF